jgi:hypothetical protein
MVNGKAQDWFRPTHPGSVWTNMAWADCRDPMVLEKDGTWYLFYTGRDEGCGICGVATAPSVLGPWTDRGAVLKVPNPTIPESCFVLADPEGGFLMAFDHAAGGGGSSVARSRSLLPINGQPPFTNFETLDQSTKPALKGWAYEFLPRGRKDVLSAYLTGYFITFEQARLVKEARAGRSGLVRPGRIGEERVSGPDQMRQGLSAVGLVSSGHSLTCFLLPDVAAPAGPVTKSSLRGKG